MKRKKLTIKQAKRSLVKQWRALECIPCTGRCDPDFVRTVDGFYGER